MVLKLPEGEKQLLWAFKCNIFHFFVNFRGMKLKPFSWKENQSLQNRFILKFARGSILEIGFEVSLKTKKNVLSVWIWSFLFWKCFWGKQGKVQNCVNPKLDIENIFCFWNYLKVKSRCSEPLKVAIFSFLQIFEWWSWNCLLWKQNKVVVKTHLIESWSW